MGPGPAPVAGRVWRVLDPVDVVDVRLVVVTAGPAARWTTTLTWVTPGSGVTKMGVAPAAEVIRPPPADAVQPFR
jgi:hypothetical protein